MPEADVANAEIARILRDLADMLEIQGSNQFRVRAYRNAARTIETWTESVSAIARTGAAALTALPFIGADMAEKVAEIVRTGTLEQYQAEARHVPPGVLELLRVPGLGPKRVRALRETLKISDLENLDAALKAGRVRKVPGFTVKTEARLIEDLATLGETAKRFLRASVTVYAEAMLAGLRSLPGVHKAEIAGSYRRRKDTVGDIDLLVSCDGGCPVIDRFVTYDGIARVLERGETRASVRLHSGLQVDLRVLDAESFGAGLHYFTGSQPHTLVMRRLAQERGLKLNEYGLFKGEKRIAGESEEEVNAALGLPWITPELREDRGEFEAAREGRLPALLELAEIRGDLQMHTDASDGRNTLETMAKAAEALGYEYIAITDHTPLLKMIQGLDRAGFIEQWKEIDKVNAKLERLTVLKAAEVDILTDGSLDLDDETLAELDLVVVSLHSKLSLEPKEQTARVLRALAHPSVDIFGHPRGRMLLKREGARFDLEQVCKVAAGNGVMLEVNAQPDRLDLDDVAVRTALGLGIKLVVSTDAHSTSELRNMKWGVDQARRGWATRADIANTQPLKSFRKLLHQARR
ncbi:MAG TPA: DNA polymerase/3'-5' exonuclease PolX [Gemmatimonadales bacterium]|jgi:DNA polymerase (family 10)